MSPTTGRAAATADLDLTTSLQDVLGMTLEIDIPVASTIFLVVSVDFELGPGTTAVAEFHLDGTPVQVGETFQTRVVAGSPSGTDGAWRGTASNNYVFSLSSGTHVLQLRARRAWGSGGSIQHPHTGFSYIIFADGS